MLCLALARTSSFLILAHFGDPLSYARPVFLHRLLGFIVCILWCGYNVTNALAQAPSTLAYSDAAEHARRLALATQSMSADPRVDSSGRRPVIGIALEGGGALGLAHIGVLEWMEQHRVPIDRVSGTSMGAMVGALFASGRSPEELRQLAESNVFEDMFTLQPALSHLSFRRREDRNDIPDALTLGLKGGSVSLGNALLTDDRVNAFLSGELAAYNAEGLNFDGLPIPFRCVATDLTDLKPMVFNSGSLALAVRSSMSIPGVFPPVRFNGHVLVDGAIMDNLPTDVLAQDLHADIVIAVHLGDAAFEEKDAASLVSVFARSLAAGTSRNEETSRGFANIQILPQVNKFSPVSYDQAAALMKAGYDAAELQRDKLLPYALSEDAWKSYRAALNARKRPAPGQIEVVKVEGPTPAVSATLQRQADKLANKPFDEHRTEALISDIRGGGALDAYYDTFHTPNPAGADKTAVPTDNGIVIHWKPNWDGPPYLLIGTDVAAMNSNVTSAVFNVRFVDENLGGAGAELRSDVRLGYLTRLSTEYYRPIASSRFFLQPRLQLLRQPVYFWEDQKRISERFLQRAGGGLDLGATWNRNFQTAIEYRASTIRWTLKEGADDSSTPYLSGTTQSVAAHILFSNRTAELASPRGTLLDLRAGRLLPTAGSSEAPFMNLRARQSFLLSPKDLIVLTGSADTYFRNDVADPLRFTLGGPARLSASSIDEYRGTDTALTQALFLRRVAGLPTGLGQGVYFISGYEAGSVWSPERPSFLRQDGLAGVLLNTPLGALTVGGSVGDAAHRKIFFTLGKLF